MKRPSIALVACPLVAVAWIASAGPPPARAQEVPAVFDRVEEDWELVIGEPDLLAEGPQITTTMSPLGDITGLFVALNLNYRSQPSYQPGGLEVVSYDGDRVLGTSTQRTSRLATEGETITWTQSLRLSGGLLDYEIIVGNSTTWGRFGQGSGANLAVRIATGLESMTAYRPTTSVSYSGPGWQSNRVSSMRLMRVRYYNGGMLVSTDETPRSVNLGL
ncbi:hypothetical protein [Tautonia sociabilis]|uniref:Uncharacterized protein n=1 Tax=Tautonia sociabilis TaxID=2080755 RepID=A0A432MHI8_9BACT|nr:hypothetical protein [Tautonia sociabilis]RUL86726.1 hypothetical protein TsocGM_15585 [Tautonia sociabilis]